MTTSKDAQADVDAMHCSSLRDRAVWCLDKHEERIDDEMWLNDKCDSVSAIVYGGSPGKEWMFGRTNTGERCSVVLCDHRGIGLSKYFAFFIGKTKIQMVSTSMDVRLLLAVLGAPLK